MQFSAVHWIVWQKEFVLKFICLFLFESISTDIPIITVFGNWVFVWKMRRFLSTVKLCYMIVSGYSRISLLPKIHRLVKISLIWTSSELYTTVLEYMFKWTHKWEDSSSYGLQLVCERSKCNVCMGFLLFDQETYRAIKVRHASSFSPSLSFL